jgi:deazaflavin-dependent oxidoreductase (nitroreductase family)
VSDRSYERIRAGGAGGLNDEQRADCEPTGARSGLRRTTPLMYVKVESALILIGSNAGAPKHPDWCYNLLANSRVGIEVGKERYEATAHVVTRLERAKLWAAIIAQYPFFIEHQAQTSREIPVIRIERDPEPAVSSVLGRTGTPARPETEALEICREVQPWLR